MHPLVCGKFIDRYVLANRVSNNGIIINENIYNELVQASCSNEVRISTRLSVLLAKIGFPNVSNTTLKTIVFVRDKPLLNFGRASYEITEQCNYRCEHCYLGEKSQRALPMEQKKEILRLIARAGCQWLQITGGEPLACKDFIEVYSFAYSLGLLITVSTNGSLLSAPEILNIFTAMPPYRVTVSLYGASANSYDALTKVQGSFARLMSGLEWVKKAGIRVRLNLIITKYNELEKATMIWLAQEFGFEYRVFSHLSPALNGNANPLNFLAGSCNQTTQDNLSAKQYKHCLAGKTFFHVNAIGKASICKVARHPSVDLLIEGLLGLDKLAGIAEQLLAKEEVCGNCQYERTCVTCAPRIRWYRRSGIVPLFVCKNQGIKGDTNEVRGHKRAI